MQEPFTYEFLGTIAGSAVATALVVEVIKDLSFFKRWPTRIVTVIVAELITLAVAWLNGKLTWHNALLYLLNGLLAASAAMTGWHLVGDKPATQANKEMKTGEKQ